MSVERLEAWTQYTDWKGTAAADGPGVDHSFEDLFEATGKVDKEKELMIAFEFYAGESQFLLAGYFHPISTTNDLGYVPSLNDAFTKSETKIKVRKITVKVTMSQFFSYFKRFNAVMIRRGLDISGREFEYED